jgi:acyl-CoA synthetase (AMP-forming)/AMP-acid ligase II
VDDALALCPGVRAVACVAAPDDYRGEVLWAFVEGDASTDAMAGWCADRLTRYKRPARFVALQALPRTGVGKLDKAALRALARDMLSLEARAKDASHVA